MATLIALLMGSCSQDDAIGAASTDEAIPVEISIGNDKASTRAPGDVALSVNRVLILPFQKTSEGLADDAANFIPVYGSAKQIDVTTFPNVVTKLSLTPATTYRILIIGYNRNDYDFANQSSISRRFDIGSASTPTTLANFHLQPISPVNVPEFFTCIATGYKNGQLVGTSFQPEQIDNIKGTLKRIVSGLTVDISNIPAYVTSVSLSAEQLVSATRATDGVPTLWQTAGDSGLKTLGSLAPVNGKVTFSPYVLAVPDARKTLLYINIAYGTINQSYPVNITDAVGVVSGNRIIFSPNHWVKITGDFINSTLVFTLSRTINLDDNLWDGIAN